MEAKHLQPLTPIESLLPSLVVSQDKTQALSNWELLKASLNRKGISDEYNLRSCLANCLCETGRTLQPIREHGRAAYFKSQYWDNVRNRKALGNIVVSDSWEYCGRGILQTSGRYNYEHTGAALNLPLLSQPDLLLVPEHSADAAAHFWCDIGKLPGLVAKIAGAENHDLIWKQVRQRVNGPQMRQLDLFLQLLSRLEVR